MNGIPHSQNFESTLHLLKDPYNFIKNQATRLKSDVFQTRLLFEKTICMTGEEAAALFIKEEIFSRYNAAPEIVRATLFGKGGIQNLNGEAHFHRKKLFMSFMTTPHIRRLKKNFNSWLTLYGNAWVEEGNCSLYRETQELLTRSVCEWAGVKLEDSEVKERTQQLTSMFDAAGSVSRHLEARMARKKAEAWIQHQVVEVRDNPNDTFLSKISNFRDLNGKLLSPHHASVEVLNLLRPTVALSAYFVFLTHALSKNRELSMRLQSDEPGLLINFVNEVRRFYPFFPALMAKVKKKFIWKGMVFNEGTRVMFDIYGTNHDIRCWKHPHLFDPDRFKNFKSLPFFFIPQGIGEHLEHHRCPGEFITVELMQDFATFMVNKIEFRLKDCDINMSRMPAVPDGEVLLDNIRSKNHLENHPMEGY